MIIRNFKFENDLYLVFLNFTSNLVSVQFAKEPLEAAIGAIKEFFDQDDDVTLAKELCVLKVMNLEIKRNSMFTFDTASITQDAGFHEEAAVIKEIFEKDE